MIRSIALLFVVLAAAGCEPSSSKPTPFGEMTIVREQPSEESTSSALGGEVCSCGMIACTGVCYCDASDACCAGCCDAAACAECADDLRDVSEDLYQEFCGNLLN
jgi:hypothetical protein